MSIHEDKANIQALLERFSIEVTPRLLTATGDMRAHLPEQTRVFITFLPGSDFNQTLNACRELLAQGMTPVPHVALRNFTAQMSAREGLSRLAEMGVQDILLIAGASPHASLAPDNVPDLLRENWFADLSWRSIGFAAHPEGNPDIPEAALREAERIKYEYAQSHSSYCYFITQFCFTPDPVLTWMRGLQARGTALPVHIGIPGLASRKSLMRHARHCGIGASAHYLRRNLANWKHFFRPQQPDNLLSVLARVNDTPLRRLHFYPLGAFENTLAWITRIISGDFVLKREGFVVGKSH